MKALLFAAGLGTRLKPFTDKHPKALVPVNGVPVLERNIRYLQSFGITDFVINIHHFGNQIVDFLEEHNHFGSHIDISDETDEVLETGGGLWKARHHFTEDFLVMNVDILTDMNISQMIDFHNTNNPLATLAISDRESSRKLMFDTNKRLCGWKNLKTGEEIITQSQVLKVAAFSGIHIISPTLFELMEERGKFSIMTTYMNLMENHTILGYDHSGGLLIDIGKPESLKEAEGLFD